MVTGSRRAVALKVELSSSSQGKKPKGGGATTRSAEQSTNVVRSARSLATALSNLNLKVFPQDGTVLPLGEPSEVVQVLQGGVLRTISQLHHFGERLSGNESKSKGIDPPTFEDEPPIQLASEME
ncbi:hypothetical protein Bca52824_026961 [Brassica carinata]|uniref:Uncharacterized protein n=1 Tax=Brassica carinata TaxID=52824 RepID=A0A8X7SJ11_BRACI|nr:hypothetical protein Bca52824_026961 [Brassica carinata]